MSSDKFTVKEINEAFYSHSGSLSTALRQLVFAEGAATWILYDNQNVRSFNTLFLLVYLAIFLFLFFDVFQYVRLTLKYQSISEEMYNKDQTHKKKAECKLKCQNVWFYSKIIAAAFSSLLFIIYAAMCIMCRCNV